MNRKRTDLLFIIGLSVFFALVYGIGIDLGLAQAGWGLLLATILPGYSVVAFFFSTHPLQLLERMVLAVGISLSLTALGALGMYWIGLPLNQMAWMAYLTGVTITGCIAALARIAALNDLPPQPMALEIKASQILLALVAVVIVGSAYWLSFESATVVQRSQHTQFWMLPDTVTGDEDMLHLGIRNLEGETVTYRVLLTATNTREIWESITLEAGAVWEMRVTHPDTGTSERPLEALLFRDEAPETVYRRVALPNINNG